MNFLEMAKAMSPFCVLCLFYFFYRLNRYEKQLLLFKKNETRKMDLLSNRIGVLEDMLTAAGVAMSDVKDETNEPKGA